jgi:hypothetical protein
LYVNSVHQHGTQQLDDARKGTVTVTLASPRRRLLGEPKEIIKRMSKNLHAAGRLTGAKG